MRPRRFGRGTQRRSGRATSARSRRCRGDDGQVVTALVVLAFGIIVAVVVMGLVPLGQATDESSQAANAADAAALAGATDVRQQLLFEVSRLRFAGLDDFLNVSPACAARGRTAAEEYAARNGASVTSYCYRAARDRVEVRVRMNATGLGANGPAVGDAVASLGLNLATCSRRDDPIVTTTTSSPPTTLLELVPPPPGPPDLPGGTLLRCDGVLLRFRILPGDGRLQLMPPGRLTQLLTPRLIE